MSRQWCRQLAVGTRALRLNKLFPPSRAMCGHLTGLADGPNAPVIIDPIVLPREIRAINRPMVGA